MKKIKLSTLPDITESMEVIVKNNYQLGFIKAPFSKMATTPLAAAGEITFSTTPMLIMISNLSISYSTSLFMCYGNTVSPILNVVTSIAINSENSTDKIHLQCINSIVKIKNNRAVPQTVKILGISLV